MQSLCGCWCYPFSMISLTGIKMVYIFFLFSLHSLCLALLTVSSGREKWMLPVWLCLMPRLGPMSGNIDHNSNACGKACYPFTWDLGPVPSSSSFSSPLSVGFRNLPQSYVVDKWYTQHWFFTIHISSRERWDFWREVKRMTIWNSRAEAEIILHICMWVLVRAWITFSHTGTYLREMNRK